MYDYNGMNETQNTQELHDTQNAQNVQSAQNTQPEMNFTEQQPPKKPRTHRTGKIVAIVAAIAVLCGGAGFGGAFAANKASQLLIGGASQSESVSSSADSTTSTSASESSVPEGAQDVLNTLQSGVVDHTSSGTAERNSDGTYAYTRDLVSAVKDSIVYIEVYVNYRGQETLYGAGSGIIISKDGYIITNAHVVDGASAISVVMTDKTKSTDSSSDSSSKSVAEQILDNQNKSDSDENTITAELVGMDTQTDLAVLKIDADDLTPAEFGTSSDIQVGEISIVIGNPLGFDLANTVTAGIISATDRTLTIEDRTMNLIQTDASINSGNSGGPLINAYGQVIGITSAKVSSSYGEGLGFAIPIDEAKDIIDDLINYGYVKGRPTLGISGENISSFYAQYYDVPQGFIVRSVESGSAADEAGIKENDIVVGIEGQLINSIEEFNEIKSQYKAGDKITVSVYRDKEITDLNVTLGEAKDTSDSSSQNSNDNQQDQQGNGNFGDFYNYYYNNR